MLRFFKTGPRLPMIIKAALNGAGHAKYIWRRRCDNRGKGKKTDPREKNLGQDVGEISGRIFLTTSS